MTLFNPLVASIVGLHDGDTAFLDVRVVALDQAWIVAGRPAGLPEVRYRFARINAPELATPAGKAAVAALAAFVGPLPAPCFIGSTNPSHYVRENYGRILVEIQLPDGTNLSDWMLANGYAVPYPKAP
jgi:endonuclease YncB( thermonuclease family)